MDNLIDAFKRKINHTHVVGPFSKISDPAIVEICGFSGFDFIILDMEHGPNGIYELQNLIRASLASSILPIVRVTEVGVDISKALDIGAAGVQIPQITTAKEAEEAIKYGKYFPHGERGVCRFVRAANYSSKDRFKYFKDANDTLVILQLEGQEAINNIDEILNVEGIDIIFIGPYDLSQSLGVAGQISHPKVEEKMKEIVNRCKENHILVGTFTDTIEQANKWRDLGVKYISYSVDVGMFYEACKDIVNSI